jgi:hypothetical protein
MLASGLRILRCNQLFEGGIDYPVVYFVPTQRALLCSPNRFCGTIKITYWLVPKDKNHYYVIKDLDDTHFEFST